MKKLILLLVMLALTSCKVFQEHPYDIFEIDGKIVKEQPNKRFDTKTVMVKSDFNNKYYIVRGVPKAKMNPPFLVKRYTTYDKKRELEILYIGSPSNQTDLALNKRNH